MVIVQFAKLLVYQKIAHDRNPTNPNPTNSQQCRFNLSAQEGDFGYDAGEVLFDKISWEAPGTAKKMGRRPLVELEHGG